MSPWELSVLSTLRKGHEAKVYPRFHDRTIALAHADSHWWKCMWHIEILELKLCICFLFQGAMMQWSEWCCLGITNFMFLHLVLVVDVARKLADAIAGKCDGNRLCCSPVSIQRGDFRGLKRAYAEC